MTPVKVHSHDVRLTYAASVESCIATEKGIFLIICTTAVCVKHILCDECSLICVNFLGFFLLAGPSQDVISQGQGGSILLVL